MDREERWRTIRQVIMNEKGGKRWLFEKRDVGGLASIWLLIGMGTSPFLLFFAIFDTSLYEIMGHAASIIAFVIGLIFVIFFGFFAMVWYNKTALRAIRPHWHALFDQSEPEWVLVRADAPYRDFFRRTAAFFREHRRLPELAEAQSIIAALRREQADLIEAICKASK